MKKIIIIVLLMFNVLVFMEVSAEDYETYQEITFENSDNQLIEDWSDKRKKQYYSQLSTKKCMFGWIVGSATSNEKISFIKDTVILITNYAGANIVQEVDLESKTIDKYQISVTGDLGIKMSGEKKKFKGGLDSSIKIKYDESSTVQETKKFKSKIIVDSGVKLKILVRGEGKISQGYALKYFFFKIVNHGAYEQLVVTTLYYDIVKEYI